VDRSSLPVSIGALGMDEYHPPPPDTLPLSVESLTPPQALAGREVEIVARVVDRTPPDSVRVFVKPVAGGFYRSFAMRPVDGYRYSAAVPLGTLSAGPYRYAITVFRAGSSMTFPGRTLAKPTDWNYNGPRAPWTLDLVDAGTPLALFRPLRDAERLAFTRIGDAGRRGLFRVTHSGATGQPVFRFELPVDRAGRGLPDYAASLVIADRIRSRQETIARAETVRIRLRGVGPRQTVHITLMEDDGTSWVAPLTVDSAWSEQTVPLEVFALGRGALLPQGFPGEWSYWVGPAAGRGGPGDRPRLARLERIQLSLRGADAASPATGSPGVEIESIDLAFRSAP
jgi:hypothetical protein